MRSWLTPNSASRAPQGERAPAEANEGGWMDSSLDLQSGLSVEEVPLDLADPAWTGWFCDVPEPPAPPSPQP